MINRFLEPNLLNYLENKTSFKSFQPAASGPRADQPHAARWTDARSDRAKSGGIGRGPAHAGGHRGLGERRPSGLARRTRATGRARATARTRRASHRLTRGIFDPGSERASGGGSSVRAPGVV